MNSTPTHATGFILEKVPNDQSSPYFLQSSDNPGAMVVQEKLLGKENFAAWERSMRLWLVSYRKLCFIIGKIDKLADKGSEEYEAWETVNRLVLPWILNLVERHIASTITHTVKFHHERFFIHSRWQLALFILILPPRLQQTQVTEFPIYQVVGDC